jgi:hypothetical protein
MWWPLYVSQLRRLMVACLLFQPQRHPVTRWPVSACQCNGSACYSAIAADRVLSLLADSTAMLCLILL